MINAGRGQYQRTFKAGLRERERGESLVADTATSWHQLVAARFSARLGLARHSGHSDNAYYHRHACDAGHCGDRRLRRCGLAPQQYLVDGRLTPPLAHGSRSDRLSNGYPHCYLLGTADAALDIWFETHALANAQLSARTQRHVLHEVHDASGAAKLSSPE